MLFVLLIIAILPGGLLLLFFYFRDRYKKEPFWPIFVSFVLGAFVTLPASVTSRLLQRFTALVGLGATNSGLLLGPSNLLNIFLGALLVIGLVEECWKFFVVRFYCYHLPEFDEPYDGILYATAVALGFATLENIFYIFTPTVFGGLRTGIMRALLAVPSHAFYGVLMGYFLGEAKFAKNETQANILGTIGLLLAILAHGLYDFLVIALPQRPLLTGSLIVFSILVWVVFFELTRRQSEKSAHRAPELIKLRQQPPDRTVPPTDRH